MINIANLIAKDKIIEVEYPTIPAWKIHIAYVPREDIIKISNQCKVVKWNKVNRQKEETIDNEKFLRLYSKEIIRGWSGLKVKDLVTLLPIDPASISNPEDDVTYDEDNVYTLMTAASDFDKFISDVINDVEAFNVDLKAKTAKN